MEGRNEIEETRKERMKTGRKEEMNGGKRKWN